MDGRSLILMLALAVSGAGLAGCIEAPSFLSETDAEATALDVRAPAADAAKAWNADAQLMGVMTIELTNSTDPRIPVDPEVGNGRAMAWWFVYGYMTPEDYGVRAYRVTPDGAVTEEKDAETLAAGAAMAEMDSVRPVSDWAIDSDAAVDAAKTNDSFRLAAQGFNATVVQGVASHEGQTIWWIVAGSVDGIVVATVDAVEGDLLEVEVLDMSFAVPKIDFTTAGPETFVPEPVLVEGEGSAIPDAPAAEYPFTIASPMEGTIAIEFTQGSLVDGLHWAILDAEGELVDADHLRSWTSGTQMYEADVEIEAPGDYVLTFEYMAWTPTPATAPLSSPVDYVFTLDLAPPGVEADEEDR